MDHIEYRAALKELGLSQAELGRWLEWGAGRKIAQSTTHRYASGGTAVQAGVCLALKILLSLKSSGLAWRPPNARR